MADTQQFAGVTSKKLQIHRRLIEKSTFFTWHGQSHMHSSCLIHNQSEWVCRTNTKSFDITKNMSRSVVSTNLKPNITSTHSDLLGVILAVRRDTQDIHWNLTTSAANQCKDRMHRRMPHKICIAKRTHDTFCGQRLKWNNIIAECRIETLDAMQDLCSSKGPAWHPESKLVEDWTSLRFATHRDKKLWMVENWERPNNNISLESKNSMCSLNTKLGFEKYLLTSRTQAPQVKHSSCYSNHSAWVYSKTHHLFFVKTILEQNII